MDIKNLYDHPEYVRVVSGWIYDEFITGKSSWSLEEIHQYTGWQN